MMNIALLLKPKMSVAYLSADNSIRQGLEKMRHHGYTEIPVISPEGIYLGTLSVGDFLWHIYDSGQLDKKEIEEVTLDTLIDKKRNPPVRIDATMQELLEHVLDQNFVPVVDDRGGFMGLVTRHDVMKSFLDTNNTNSVK